MTIDDYINAIEFNKIKEAIAKEKDFEFMKMVKKLKFRLASGRVNDEYAENIWHGHHYLVHVDCSRQYGNYMGHSHATIDFTPFQNWYSFKKWFNKLMSQFEEFEVSNEPEQLNLFEM